MRSLLISGTYFPPQVGGISHFMAAIASSLSCDRICCLTGVPARKGDGRDPFKGRVYRRPLAFAKEHYLQAAGWGMAIAEIMVRERPQVVQIATADEGYMGLWLRRWFKLPYIVYAHGNEILAAMKNSWQKPRLALQQADRIIANSHFTANLAQQAGVDPRRIEIVHPGCDVNRFKPSQPHLAVRQKFLGGRYRDHVILSVGGLVPRKGHDMVIRALSRLLQRVLNVSYLIIGDGPYRSQLDALAHTMGVRDRVIFAGRVPEEDLPDIYALSDIFVMPSRAQLEACDVEGFGLVFLEANACGKPVIGGRSGGIPDAIVDGVTGLVVNPHDPEDIANALARLLRDSDLAKQLGEQGRLRVVSNFTWGQVGDRVQSILEDIVWERLLQGRQPSPRRRC